MRKNLLFAILTLTGAAFIWSCNKGDMIYDISPVKYMVKVVDGKGNDLLDPTKDGSVDYGKIEVVYKGETYKITSDAEVPTKAYKPHFEGLKLIHHPYWECYVLSFGELEGAQSYDHDELLIDWGDETRDLLSFTRTFEWGKNGEPEIEHQWFLNGRKYDGSIFELVKEKQDPPVEEQGPVVEWPEETRVSAEGGKFYIPIITDKEYRYSILRGSGSFRILHDECSESVIAIEIFPNSSYEENNIQLMFEVGDFKQYVSFVQDPVSGNIVFEDQAVKAVCIAAWDTNKDGELSYKEAFEIEYLKDEFYGNTEITEFNELKYFTGLRELSYSGLHGTFEGCSSLTAIEIPESVMFLGFRTFAGCTALTDVKLTDNIRDLGTSTFYNCKSLRKVVLPGKITVLEDELFYGCNSMESIEIPESVSRIGFNAFWGCAMKEIIIPDSVTEIGQSAFSHSDIEKIILPEGLESFETGLFGYCTKLKEVTIPTSVKRMGEYCFMGCEALEVIVIPESLTAIPYRAFQFCSGLKSVSLPSTLTRIAEDAFSRTNITEGIVCHAVTPPVVSQDAFEELNAIFVPDESVDAYKAAEHWSSFSDRIHPLSDLKK